MQSQDSCYGVAFRSIITNDEALFKKTIHFYHTLGFATVKDFNKFKHGENSLLSSGTSQDSLREVWLESFKLSEVDASGFRIPQQEATNKAQSQGALLKIRLVMSAPIDETFDTNETATITYFSTDLNKIVEKFPKQAEKLSDTLVFLKDPMGNNITFSGLANATDSAPTSKDAFLEATSEDEIISRASSDASDLLRQTLGSSQKKKKIAVMTSGGDSPGMNAAVRAVVRTGIHFGCDVFAVYEGYEGLLRGGKYLKKMAWEDVRGWLSEGGTLIGTARSMEFRKREGRRQAAGNLIRKVLTLWLFVVVMVL